MQTKAQNFRAGLRDGLPICLGYFAVSFAFGIQAAGIGLSVPEAAAVSAAIFPARNCSAGMTSAPSGFPLCS